MAADEKALADGLDKMITSRDWKKDPPRDDETMEELGAGAGQMDGPIRAWINATFRKPKGWPLFAADDLTIDMEWADFKKKVLTHEAKAKAAATKSKAEAKAKAKAKAKASKARSATGSKEKADAGKGKK